MGSDSLPSTPHLVLVTCSKKKRGEDGDAWKVTCHVGLQLVGGVDRDFANLAPYISCRLSPELRPLGDRILKIRP